jgi:hypothetical protein
LGEDAVAVTVAVALPDDHEIPIGVGCDGGCVLRVGGERISAELGARGREAQQHPPFQRVDSRGA